MNQTNEDLHLDFDDVNFDYVDFIVLIRQPGLAMHGGFDSAGNTFGTCWQDYDDRR
ncbi:conjugal transfer protein TraS (plasmid) [Escherichia coli]|nr:conjugal transfer protein TraS [Escherichia coli]